MGFLTANPVGPLRAAALEQISDEIGGWYVAKTSDESVTSSTTLQNDDELFIPVVASATYIMTSMIVYRAAATPQIKINWTVPAGGTMLWTPGSLDSAVTAGFNGNINKAIYDLSVAPTLGCGGAAQSIVATPSGVITTSSTAGNLQFQWAQFASNATATVVKAGSWIHLVRVA